MGYSRQGYWSDLLCPPPGGLSNPGIKPVSLTSLNWQAGSLPLAPPGKPTESNYKESKGCTRQGGIWWKSKEKFMKRGIFKNWALYGVGRVLSVRWGDHNKIAETG